MVVLTIVGFSQFGRAEILTSVNYFQYSKDEKINVGTNTETRITSYDFSLQFIMGSSFLVGATQMTQTSSSGDVRGHRESFAPNIGFLLGPFLLEGGPISKSTEKADLNEAKEWREGKGYYASICLLDRVSSWLLIGFQFTFIDIEYKKYFDGINESADQKKNVSVLSPSIRLSVLF
tara:strand:+ start:68741 stop:69271 length:531 start_codon:yes stop_codon:yes gene_type:complete